MSSAVHHLAVKQTQVLLPLPHLVTTLPGRTQLAHSRSELLLAPASRLALAPAPLVLQVLQALLGCLIHKLDR